MKPAITRKRSAKRRGRRRSTSTPGELAEFREIFALVDRNGGGTVTRDKLGELMNIVGIETKPREIDLLVGEVDRNGDGAIGFDGEYLMACSTNHYSCAIVAELNDF